MANIKHRKRKSDAKKRKAFSRAAKEIITRQVGRPDPKIIQGFVWPLRRQRSELPMISWIEISKSFKCRSSWFYWDDLWVYGHGELGLLPMSWRTIKTASLSDMRIATNKRGGHVAIPALFRLISTAKESSKFRRKHAKKRNYLAALKLARQDFETARISIWLQPILLIICCQRGCGENGIKSRNLLGNDPKSSISTVMKRQ